MDIIAVCKQVADLDKRRIDLEDECAMWRGKFLSENFEIRETRGQDMVWTEFMKYDSKHMINPHKALKEIVLCIFENEKN